MPTYVLSIKNVRDTVMSVCDKIVVLLTLKIRKKKVILRKTKLRSHQLSYMSINLNPPPLSLFFSLSLCLSLSLSLSFSFCLSLSFSLSLSVCLSLCLCRSISLYLSLSPSLQSQSLYGLNFRLNYDIINFIFFSLLVFRNSLFKLLYIP